MNIFRQYQERVREVLTRMMEEGALPAGLDLSRVVVEPPRDTAHGELSSNAAMVLAKQAGKPPREIAQALMARLAKFEQVRDLSIAGPGFLNWRLDPAIWRGELVEVLRVGDRYGDSQAGKGIKVNVEYVSANPTGPLTVGHARGAVFGDALSSLLDKAGYEVTREYYINDAGAQVDTLARTAHLRYREAQGEVIAEIPSGYYPGEYMKDVGEALKARDGDKWLGKAEAEWLEPVRRFAIDFLMQEIKDDLAVLGIHQEVFTSERALVEAGAVEAVEETLTAMGLLYVGVLEPPKGKKPDDWEPRPQTLFKATQFGDEVDRPLKKSDGTWTYFANDMANHLDKFRRGFTQMIDVWGADHSGYIKRMQAAVTALTAGKGALDVKICQLVKLTRGGQPMKMSKRAGTYVALRDLVNEIGKDVVRFIMLTRKNDAPLDFDLDKVLEQSKDNPVFYVHYAHARACSVLRHGEQEFPNASKSLADLTARSLESLTDSQEIDLIRRLAEWPRIVESAAEAHEPHRVAFYLQEIAAGFHGLWTRGKDEAEMRFLIPDRPDVTVARLALVRGVKTVLASGLRVFGVEPLEEMR